MARFTDLNPNLDASADSVWTMTSAFNQASAKDFVTQRLVLTASNPRCATIIRGSSVASVKAQIAEAVILSPEQTEAAAADYLAKLAKRDKKAAAKAAEAEAEAAFRKEQPVQAAMQDFVEAAVEVADAVAEGVVCVAAVVVQPVREVLEVIHAQVENVVDAVESGWCAARRSLCQIAADAVASARQVVQAPYTSFCGRVRVA